MSDQDHTREKAYEKLFHGIHEAVFVHDFKKEGFNTFLEVNDFACSRYGYTREEFLQLSPENISVPENTMAKGSREGRRRLKESGQAVFEVVHVAKDGTEFPVVINSRVFTHQGRDVILSIVRDITDLKQAEKEKDELQTQLWQAQKMDAVGRLAGGIAHDFNNMLAVILGHVELAMAAVPSDHPLNADLMEINKAAQRSRDLTRQLLAFARRQTMEPVILDLNEHLKDDLAMLGRLIGEDIELAWFPAAELWPVKMDPGQIIQILTNLCVNARDAIEGPGKVTVETGNVSFGEGYCNAHLGYAAGDYVMIAVSDDGCGMTTEVRAQVFEPFYTTKEKGKGTGLGLAMVYGIVKQNGGFINLYSEVGQGTTFKIYLKRHHEKIEKVITEAVQPDTVKGQELLLLVEDESAIRDFSRRMLEKMGYSILTAATSKEALDQVKNSPRKIDLLITDVVLPDMNGADLAHCLKTEQPGLKVLFMSGYTANVIARRGVMDEGVHFLQKPFSMGDLRGKVHQALADPG